MKLKRILSLALSGVLAVSMLTACGGGSGIFGANDQSGTFARLLNSKLDDATAEAIEYSGRSRFSLNSAIRDVANTLSENQISNGPATGTIPSTVQQLTQCVDLNINDEWVASPEDRNHVKVFVYDADNDDYNTLDEVATAVRDQLNTMKLGDEQALSSGGFTNEYSGYVAAYQTTLDAGEEDAHAWVIGVVIVQDSEPVASTNA